jgi:hypothetical protein
VNTGGYGVDNPMASGGSINMVTKSGSNKYEFEFNATADSNRLRFFTDKHDAVPRPIITSSTRPSRADHHATSSGSTSTTETYYQQIGRDRDVEGYLPDAADLPEVGARRAR